MSGFNLNGGPQNGTPGGTEKKVPPKLQKQKSFTVTTVYTPPSNPSKAIQKLRAKTRAAKAFKNILSVSKDLPIRDTLKFFIIPGSLPSGSSKVGEVERNLDRIEFQKYDDWVPCCKSSFVR